MSQSSEADCRSVGVGDGDGGGGLLDDGQLEMDLGGARRRDVGPRRKGLGGGELHDVGRGGGRGRRTTTSGTLAATVDSMETSGKKECGV